MDQRKLDLGLAGMDIKDDTVTGKIKGKRRLGGVLSVGVGRVDLSVSTASLILSSDHCYWSGVTLVT